MSVEAIRAEREANEAKAAERAASLLPGLDLYADGNCVKSRSPEGVRTVLVCESHWNACLVLLAYGKAK